MAASGLFDDLDAKYGLSATAEPAQKAGDIFDDLDQKYLGAPADQGPAAPGPAPKYRGSAEIRDTGRVQSVVAAARSAGFFGKALETAVAVALAESGGNHAAIGDRNYSRQGEKSIGLWQINFRPGRDEKNPVRDPRANMDPSTNAKNAYAISGGGKNFRPWTTYRNGAYKKHLEAARAAIQRSGGAGAGALAGVGIAASEVPGLIGSAVSGALNATPGQVADAQMNRLAQIVGPKEPANAKTHAARTAEMRKGMTVSGSDPLELAKFVNEATAKIGAGIQASLPGGVGPMEFIRRGAELAPDPLLNKAAPFVPSSGDTAAGAALFPFHIAADASVLGHPNSSLEERGRAAANILLNFVGPGEVATLGGVLSRPLANAIKVALRGRNAVALEKALIQAEKQGFRMADVVGDAIHQKAPAVAEKIAIADKPVRAPEVVGRNPKGKAKEPWEMTRKNFQGTPRLYSGKVNAAEGPKKVYASTESAPTEPFMGGRYTIKKGPDQFVVYDGGKPIATYSLGDNLVVDSKYRRQGIGTELLKAYKTERDALPQAASRSREADALYSKAHYQLVESALKEGKPVPPEVLADYPDLAAKYGKTAPRNPKAKSEPPIAKESEPIAKTSEQPSSQSTISEPTPAGEPPKNPAPSGLSRSSRSLMADVYGTTKPVTIHGKSLDQLYEEGKQKVSEGFDAEGEIHELAKAGRPASDEQIGIFSAFRDKLITDLNTLNERLDSPLSPDRHTVNLAERDALLNRIAGFDRSVDEVKAAGGRSLGALRIGHTVNWADLGESLAEGQRIKGSALTTEEIASVQKVHEELAAALKERDAAMSEAEMARANEGVARVMQDAVQRGRRRTVKQVQTEKAASKDRIREIFSKSFNQGPQSLGLQTLADLIEAAPELAREIRRVIELTIEEYKLKAIDARFYESVRKELDDLGLKDPDTGEPIQITDSDIRATFAKHYETTSRTASEATRNLNELRRRADLFEKIEKAKEGDPVKGQPVPKPSDEVKRLRTELNRILRTMGASPTDNAVRTRLQGILADAEDMLKVGYRNIKKKNPPTPADVKALKTRIAEVRKEMRHEDTIADLETQLEKGQFKGPSKRVTITNNRIERLDERVQTLRSRVRQQVEAMKPKGIAERWLEYGRAIKISGFGALGKIAGGGPLQHAANLAADPLKWAAGKLRLGGKSLEELAGRAPTMRGAAIGTRGLSPLPTTKAGWQDLIDAIKHGTSVSEPDRMGKPDIITRTHIAGASPSVRAELDRSIRERTTFAAKKGLDIQNPDVQAKIRAAATTDAAEIAFRAENKLSKWINNAFREGMKPGKGVARGASFVGSSLLPVLKKPLNWLAQSLEYTGLGIPKAAAQHIHAIASKTVLTEAQARGIINAYGRGGLGAAMGVMVLYNPHEVEEFLNTLDESLGGFGKYLAHAPVLEGLRLWSIVGTESDGNKIAEVTKEIGHETPGSYTVTKAADVLRGQASITDFAINWLKDMTLPLQPVRQIAQTVDKGRRRVTKNAAEDFQQDIPVLRERLALATIFESKGASDPVVAELRRIGYAVRTKQGKEETPAEYQERSKELADAAYPRILEVIKSPEYKHMTRQEKKEVAKAILAEER